MRCRVPSTIGGECCVSCWPQEAAEVEGIIVAVGVVVDDEGGEVAVVVYVEDPDGVV